MELKEIFASPFTTQTTCYSSSSGRKNNDERRLTASLSDLCELHFATETNLLAVQIDQNDVKTACRPLPRDSAQMTCIGYASQSNEQQHVEAMALLDPELLQDNDVSSPNLHQPSTVPHEKDDTTSVATPKSQLKRSSTLSSTSAATNSPPLSSSYHRKSTSELSKGSHATITTTSDALQQPVPNGNGNTNSGGNFDSDKNKSDDHLSTQPKSKARLLLKQNQYSDPESAHERQPCPSAIALLDFRPLCPCIATWGHHVANESPFLGIWVGSADDAILRLYAPSGNDPRKLIPVRLPEEHFSVDSPVMALDYCSVSWNDQNSTKTTHTLAVACQDGTIQLITWTGSNDTATNDQNKKSIFGIITSQKVIVDGPLVCLKLDYNPWASLRVVVGSLCGFVCQLTYDFNNKSGTPLTDSFWEGPYMVAQDLFHSSLGIEESVLTVDIWENYVAVGTQLGRCLLYATHDSENYFPTWQVVLPYPIHNVTIIASSAESNDLAHSGEEKNENDHVLSKLAVTTRRSFHVFQGTSSNRGTVWKEKPKKDKYSSELAMKNLAGILEGIRRENQASDSTTRKCVQETMDDLLETVQANAEVATLQTITTAPVTTTTTTDSNDPRPEQEKPETGSSSPTDAPHWEYSSSDEEEGDETVHHESLTEEAEC